MEQKYPSAMIFLYYKENPVNIFFIGLITLCTAYTPLVFGDSSTSSDSATLQAIENSLSVMSSRVPESAYAIRDLTGSPRTAWLEDFFNIYKYYELRRDEREAYFFYMNAPSQGYFTSIYSTARQNYMFLMPFSYYDGIGGLSKTVENNYLYIYKMDTYEELIKPNFIESSSITSLVTPSESNLLPRTGTRLTAADNISNELIRVSSVEDFVFKHFYLYCAEGAEETCSTILGVTSGSGAFSVDGMGTTRPNADINPESLLASPSFAHYSSGHTGAIDFIRTISNPTPRLLIPFKADPSQPGAYIPDTGDVKQIGKNLTDAAYRNLSAHVLNDIKNRRIQSINPTKNASTTSGSISNFEFLHSLAMDRMLTSNGWLTQMNVTSQEGLLRELVIIQASALMLQHQQFRQMENLEALLAAMVAQNQNLIEAINFTGDMSKVQDSIAAVG